MKRFNTDRIRQRMREHNERFPNSKGKLLSSAPVRIPLPKETEKENVVPVKNDADEINVEENIFTEDTYNRTIPQLSIAVTMSEDDDDDDCGSCDDSAAQNKSSRASDNEDCSTVPSVWAMMEHYQGTLKDSSNGEQTLLDEPVTVAENDFIETSDHRIVEGLSHSDNTSNDVDSNESNDNEEGLEIMPKTIENFKTNDEISIPTRMNWSEDGDGRLVKNSFCTLESSERGNKDMETSNSHFIDYSMTKEDEKRLIFRPETASCVSDQAVSPIYVSHSNGPLDEPTPARVREEWIHPVESEGVTTHPGSLLDLSMVHSIQLTTNSDPGVSADTATNLSTSQIHNDSSTQFSLGSPVELKNNSKSESNTSSSLVTKNVTKPKLQIQTQGLKDHYFDRLGELESNLKIQQNNTDEVQQRLKERVMELEQALKVTAATPRGTIVDENPLQTLLNRNQTLVKEVRFADQTCVELSSKIAELEMRNERLQNKVVDLEQEKDSIQAINDKKEVIRPLENSETETMIKKLENELSLAEEKLRKKTTDEENLCSILAQAICDLNINDDTLGLSMASSIVSQPESSSQDHSIDDKSLQISRTIQQQIDVLVERAKSNLQSEQMKKKLHELRAENIGLKSELLVQVSSESMRVDSAIEDSNEVSRLQEENEFLGRQLGIVQNKLDQAQEKLRDECQKSESLQMHLELSAETYKQLVEPLERRLIEVTECDPKLQNVADADSRLYCLEKELIYVKASVDAIKRESERLLTASSFDISAISDSDQQQQIAYMVQTTVTRMIESYKQLEQDVDSLTVGFSERLEKLTASISHLRSSLLFEKESVSSVGSNMQEESKGEILLKKDNAQNCGSPINLINASIPAQQETRHDEDEIYKLMEEARSPRKQEISISSELDDVSRLLSDDLTIGSFVKTGSLFSSMSNMDAFKESLEAAVNECKRAKDRSIMLKDEIESHKSKIQSLEKENGKLSLHESRRSEEFALLQNALEEAKEELNLLRNATAPSRGDKETVEEQNKRFSKSMVEVQKEKEELEMRVKKYASLLAQTKKELESLTSANDEYKKRLHDLQSHLSIKIHEATERKDLESVETRRSLQMALRENSELKRTHQDTVQRLSQEIESKLKLKSLVSELEQSQLQAQSDLEDQDLESKYACEDMRKERAELRYKLSQSEKDVLALKELYTNYKTKMEAKCQGLEETENQMSELLSKMKLMTDQRTHLGHLLENLACCEDLFRVINSDDYNSSSNPFKSGMTEIDCWNFMIPLISEKFEALHHAKATIPQLEVEIQELHNDVSKYKIRESDQLKQVEDQSSQNKKLFDLLRQAEGEMERSTIQIKDMSEALAVMQQRENEGNIKLELMESEFLKLKKESERNELIKKEEFIKVKDLLLDTSATLEKKESQILDMNSEMNLMKSELEDVHSLLRSKVSEQDSLKVNIESFEKKNTKLREYIRKLTTKCEEWETSYDRQSRAIDRLQEKKNRMKEKACDIAGRYRALVADINRRKKLHQNDREKWSHERMNLNSVHAALEQELEQIAKELA